MTAFVLIAALLLTAKDGGTIIVRSMTAGAKVFLDDRAVGSAPVTLKSVVPGKHTVKLKKRGFLDVEEIVEVRVGRASEIDLELLPYAGVLKATANQKNTQVFVDGKLVGTAPYEGDLQIGRRTIELKKDGYAAHTQVLQVGAGTLYEVKGSLHKDGRATSDLSGDLPLVAVSSKKKKAAKADGGATHADDDYLELPLIAPSTGSRQKQPVGVQVDPPVARAEVATNSLGPPWYTRWWVWTAAGAVVASAIIVPVAITQSGTLPPERFPNQAGPFVLNPRAR